MKKTKSAPRDAVVQLRATAEECARWKAAAEDDSRSLSGWLRVVANAEANKAVLGDVPGRRSK